MNKNTDLTFNKLFSLFFLLILASCSNPDPISTSSDKLIKRNNVSFFKDSNTPFTGEVVDYHSNKNLKMTGNFIDGKKEAIEVLLEGDMISFFATPDFGRLSTISLFHSGREGLCPPPPDFQTFPRLCIATTDAFKLHSQEKILLLTQAQASQQAGDGNLLATTSLVEKVI